MEVIHFTPPGNYHLVRHLAYGGMSTIYLVRDKRDERLYAIKVVRPEIAENYRHFRREMSILNELQHEHILPIVDMYTGEDGVAAYVSPYIEHGSLREHLKAGPLSPEEASVIVSQVGDALQYIHDRGLVHRDIKSANILVDETQHAWLADFGLARETAVSSDVTGTGCLLGTPAYLAPELLERSASISSDIYALGVVLYEMVTGVLPFTGATPLAVCMKHAYEAPLLPSLRNSRVSPAIDRVILRALAKNPAERFATVREFVKAYQQALLAPVLLAQTVAGYGEVDVPGQAETISIVVKPLDPRLKELAFPPRRLSLTVAVFMLAMLFVFGAVSLAVEYQANPTITPRVGAQSISLHASTPILTATPSPRVTVALAPSPGPATPASPHVAGSGNVVHRPPDLPHPRHQHRGKQHRDHKG